MGGETRVVRSDRTSSPHLTRSLQGDVRLCAKVSDMGQAKVTKDRSLWSLGGTEPGLGPARGENRPSGNGMSPRIVLSPRRGQGGSCVVTGLEAGDMLPRE